MGAKQTRVRGRMVGSGLAHDDGRSRSDSTATDPGVIHQYECDCGHVTAVRFSVDADVPALWDCDKCGLGAQHPTVPLPEDTSKKRETYEDLHGPAWPDSWVTEFHHREIHKRRSISELETLLEWSRQRCPFVEKSNPAA